MSGKENVLVFIDDSGDPGFKIEKGSTEFFVISCIIFQDELEAEKTAVAIKQVRRDLKFPDTTELKFNKSRKKVRVKFLQTVNKFYFKVRSLVVEKELIRSKELRNNKNSFYSYAIKLLLRHSGGSVINAKVRIDGSGDRIFRRNFITYLRKQLNTHQRKIMKDCKLVNSKANVLIQMADMVAGAIRRSYDETKTDAQLYKSIIKAHIEDEWRFK